jgi:hypothetical protein
MAKKMTLEEIQNELDLMYYNLEKLCKLHYTEWSLEERMKYGRLHAMKQRRLAEKDHV